MNINIVSIIKQKIGTKAYYWGQDNENHIYLLNRYDQLKHILNSIPKFKQDQHNIFQKINFNKNDSIKIPRKKIIRITHADYSLSF
ncbi:MAG: hypothetical protein U9P73_08245 [Candidatus Cloacimonadota bacterium]|nr:hypothetical protein [Candidatus Cloacimonadota bacterium]